MDVKKVLLNLAEENAKVLLKEVLLPMAEEYVKNSPNKIDDIILPFMGYLETGLIELIDKIDNEAG